RASLPNWGICFLSSSAVRWIIRIRKSICEASFSSYWPSTSPKSSFWHSNARIIMLEAHCKETVLRVFRSADLPDGRVNGHANGQVVPVKSNGRLPPVLLPEEDVKTVVPLHVATMDVLRKPGAAS